MQVRREANLVAPFSHALHLFRPDPQRSICIGKRNHERLRAPGQGAAVRARLLRGQGGGCSREAESCGASLQPTWSGLGTGPGRRRVERSRPGGRSGLPPPAACPIYARRRPWRRAHGAAALACGRRLRRPRTRPPPHLRDRGTKTRSERGLCCAPRAGGGPGPRGLRVGLGKAPALAGRPPPGLISLPATTCVRAGKHPRYPLPLPSPRWWQRPLPPPGLQPHCQGHELQDNPPPAPRKPRLPGGSGESCRAMHTSPGLSPALLPEPLGVLRWAGALPSWGQGAGEGTADDRLSAPAQAGAAHVHCASAGQGGSGPAACGSPVLGRVRGQLGPEQVSGSAHRTSGPVLSGRGGG